MSDQVISIQALAKLCNLTERRCQQLANEGVMEKKGRGDYTLVASVNGYIVYLQELVNTSKESDGLDFDEKVELAKQKLRKLRLEADKLDREKSKDTGVWAHREEYAKSNRRIFLKIKAMIDQFMEAQKKRIPDLSASESEEIDREKIEFFNGIADLSKK